MAEPTAEDQIIAIKGCIRQAESMVETWSSYPKSAAYYETKRHLAALQSILAVLTGRDGEAGNG